ncbi:MAG: peptidyl-prolyl cis-trans isomerase, partial [Nitrospirota bacterium]
VPLISSVDGDRPVAVVNAEPITIEDLRSAVSDAHQRRKDDKAEEQQGMRMNVDRFLKRLINATLVVQEAESMGLAEVPSVKEEMDRFSQITLRNLLRESLWKDLTVSEAEVTKYYEAAQEEMKITLVVFGKKNDARKAAARIRKGAAFSDVVTGALRDGTAIGVEGGSFFRKDEIDPLIAKKLPGMKIGEVSPVLKMEKDKKTVYGLFQLEEGRIVEDLKVKEAARNILLTDRKKALLGTYLRSLYKIGIKTDVKIIKGLDYGPTGPGLEKLMQDDRVAVVISGEAPITVGDISAALEDKLYHGAKNASTAKLAQLKQEAVEEILQKRLLYREALKRGVDRTELYQRMYRQHRRNFLFGTFIEKVVVPSIRVVDDDIQAYYRVHESDFRTSEMVRMRALAFDTRDAAALTLGKLKEGTDYQWIRTNAEGLRNEPAGEKLAFAQEQPVASKALPEDVRTAIEGGRSGDFRLYDGAGGTAYILQLLEVVPPQPLPVDNVKATIRAKVFGQKLESAMEAWVKRLSESSEINVYLADYMNR